MTFYIKSFHGQRDLARIVELVFTHPNEHQHVVDLEYRLTSWALNDERNIALWENEKKQLVGWAIIQQPFAALDYAVLTPNIQLEKEIILWGKQRWQQIADETKKEMYFFIGVKNTHVDRIKLLLDLGFQKDDWGLSHMMREMKRAIPKVSLPEGFILRPLAGEKEVEAYTDLHQIAFQSKNMKMDWRRRILQAKNYTPDLDLVIVGPDGKTLVAFCICWKCIVQGEIFGQVEPLGVHPDYQKLGLGKAILIEGLRRMQAYGVKTALIESYSSNKASQNLYHKVGFQTIYETNSYYLELKANNPMIQ